MRTSPPVERTEALVRLLLSSCQRKMKKRREPEETRRSLERLLLTSPLGKMKKRREPEEIRQSKVLLILGVILIPAGIGTWLLGMSLAFAGGGGWALVILGYAMIPLAFVAKVAIGLYVWLKKEESIPVWYWSDFVILGGLAAVIASVSAWESSRSTPPAPPPVVVPPLTLKVVDTLEDIATLQLLEDGRVRLRSNGARMGVHDSRQNWGTDQADMVQPDAAAPNEISLAPGQTGGIWDGRTWRLISFQAIEEGRARFLVGWLVPPPGRSVEWCLVAPYGP